MPKISIKMMALVSWKFLKCAEMNSIIMEGIQEDLLFNFSNVLEKAKK